jgi:hypothetical protein
MTIGYDLGAGHEVRQISPRAMVAWELGTKSKISDFATGIGVSDLSRLLLEQMKLDGDAYGAGTLNDLLDALVDIGPEVDETPTSPDEEPLPATSSNSA